MFQLLFNLNPDTYLTQTAVSALQIKKQGVGALAITDRQNREEIQKIREALDQLEGNRAPDVIDVESNGSRISKKAKEILQALPKWRGSQRYSPKMD